MALLKGVVLCMALLLLSHLPRYQGVQRSQGVGGEYGVKLCGREFIRAVIFTCGGSRWKRLSLEGEESEEKRVDRPTYQRKTEDAMEDSSNKERHQLKLQSLFGSHMEQIQKSGFPLKQKSLKDFINSYDDYSDFSPTSDDFGEYVRQVEEATREDQSASDVSDPVESDAFSWYRLPRRRREMHIGVAGICCKWGCTKAEISTLC
ncbi:relaxin-3-like [Rhinophrynus dorsalis]